jgi:type IV pilus assembly protein PilM
MKESLWVKLLPPPDFLLMPTFGVDISDKAIRMICLEESHGGLKVKAITEHFLPEGVVVGGRVEKVDELARLFRGLAKEYKINYATLALPEDLSYAVTMSLPAASAANLRESVELQLEEYVPITIKDVSFDAEVFRMPTATEPFFELVVGVASKREMINSLELCQKAGVILRAIELESQALARALIKKADLGTYMIVDFGDRRASFSVVAQGLVVATSSVPSLGGEALTKAIQKSLGTTLEEAEKIKIEKGLLGVDKNSDPFFSMMAHVSSLRDELITRIDYWQSKKEGLVKPRPVTKVILSGGQSLISGLVDYFSETLDLPVELGNPWVNVVDFGRSVPSIDRGQSLRFAKAIGLALRHLAYGH